jgi:hypothetical protein
VFDFHERLVDEWDGSVNWERIDGLIDEFLASDEGKPFQQTGAHYVVMVIDYAFQYEAATLADVDRRVIGIVLFSLFPEKVSTEPQSASAIVSETRAFWTFLQRQYGLKTAAGILSLLDANAADRLERELADPSNYGMAKSFFMAGSEAGFDMTTQEGLDKFRAVFNSRLEMPPVPAQSALPPDRTYADYGMDDLSPPFPRLKDETPAGPTLSPKERAEMRKKKRKANKRNRQ